MLNVCSRLDSAILAHIFEAVVIDITLTAPLAIMSSTLCNRCLHQQIGSPTSSSTYSEAAFSSASLEAWSSPRSSTSAASTPFRRSTDNVYPNMRTDDEHPGQIVIHTHAGDSFFQDRTLQTDAVQEAKRMVTELHPVLDKGKICWSIMGDVLAKHSSFSLFGFQFPWCGLEIVYMLSLCGMYVASKRIMEVASGKVLGSSTGFWSLSFLERTFHSLASGRDVLLGGICAHVAHQAESDVVEKVAIAFALIVACWPDWLNGRNDGAGGSSTKPRSNGQGLIDAGYGDNETQPLMVSLQSDAGTFQDLEHGPTSV